MPEGGWKLPSIAAESSRSSIRHAAQATEPIRNLLPSLVAFENGPKRPVAVRCLLNRQRR